MKLQFLISQLIDPEDTHRTITAVRRLSAFVDDSQVMDALCALAVRTIRYCVREAVIDVLKANPAGAGMRLSDYVLWSKIPSVRKWALVSLGLMRWRDAKDAVISGLYDPDASVRQAAAMSSTGLYDDSDVQAALEHYFANHRLDSPLSFIAENAHTRQAGTRGQDDDEVSTTTVFI
ncbi:HEAT repeat domain-containing protein [Desulfosarcina ovata]|uniref:HEAT repeat domain-containing protein n=2 Tax=Desulfosarcina ovata TaxID=83564 RepID=A0A5K8A8M8_9BACT|nr:HEAT repeat domain-containing protein [Desulfosarcina ovata]BBO81435.1 hypothetical protein DSCO28_20010 [Desulfosarcina ovata subsp. sediminis]BBO88694.1 hypothetical protein DSCOOX_18740 [Desulfosarcina ovata subsp. ovata]